MTERLIEAGCIAAGEEADELIQAAAGDPDVLDDLISRRTTGEPIAWLTGAVVFCGIRLFVAPGVYVPRWQTEPLARRAMTLLPFAGVAVDLCTGTGAIAAVLAAAVPSAQVLGTELDLNAVRCARRNGVEVFEGFLDDPLPREFEHRVDVLTAVVPYVPTDSLRFLPRDVQAFEPRLALDGGVDGTDLLEEVVRRSARWLSSGGWLLLELGGEQAEPLGQLLRELGFEGLDVMADEDGDPRAICAQLGEARRRRPRARGLPVSSTLQIDGVPSPSAMDIEKLRSIPLFADMSDHALERIAELATEFEAPAGYVLVEIGQPGTGMFVLEEGSVNVEMPDGRTKELGMGDFFGELALLTDHPRNARVRAKTPVRCLAISRMDLSRLMREEPSIGVDMLPKLASRVPEAHT